MTNIPGTVTHQVNQFEDWLDELPPVTDQASAIDRLQSLTRIQGIVEAAQADVVVELENKRLAQEAEQRIPKAQRGKGLGSEIAMARHESPARGKKFLALARALHNELPNTRKALTRGHIREEHAQAIAKETTDLSAEHRREVDHALKGRLGQAGPYELANHARAHAQRLDPKTATRRHEKGTKERRITCESIGDGLAKLTAIGSANKLQSVYQNLLQYGKSKVSTGQAKKRDGQKRTRDQVMFDEFIVRGTGQQEANAVPVQILLTISPETLFAGGDAPAWLVGYGPIPAEIARLWLSNPAVSANIRRLFTDPKGHQIMGLESRSRAFPEGLRRMILVRDDRCRNPYCEAVIQDADHMTPRRQGGATTWVNASGLCAACNQTKENRGWKHEGDATSVTVTTPTGHQYTKTAGSILPGSTPAPTWNRRTKQPDDEADDPDDHS